MNEVTALRLYLPQGARAKPTKLWHHLSAPALSHHLLKAAKRADISQALLISVHAGYLAGSKLSHQHPESAPAHHPLCIELVDTEEKLRNFLLSHAHELGHVRSILYKCELVI